ncbi:bacterio-opsin activator domain-containing protein [Halobacterium salinarum]|uniref:bacterio-opsin activator domain-containing protein n=1 Tax=Halobacterium salinarum TaxID=2242 RepID=UPI0025572569|nr:bacterio-opsin activator domain-containing protein [Halobacterium salinarum]MDL0120242.1 bacterio-opsin activator domain-containing protein [Halobacterium salinarum]
MVSDDHQPVSAPVFNDPDRFVAVVDADGVVLSANDAAADAATTPAAALQGRRLWGLPWANPTATRHEVQRAVRAAANDEYASFDAAFETQHTPAASGRDAEPSVQWAFRVQPVPNDDRLVVQGDVRREREQLAEELRASEELHRVTLNNMTDTVLVTDDDGTFTYVCPNAHYIFGYTAEEIRAFGTIDELLGCDPVGGDSLSRNGVVTNVECTATDANGDQHTLLVNVREVSIQGGTRLYSCRDVTTRKQREDALAQLQETSRDLLYAGTATEAATRVVDDGTAALPAGGIAVYRFDRHENRLYPVAAADNLAAAVEDVGELRLDDRSPVGTAFVADRVVDSGAEGEWDAGVAAGLAEWTALPIGDHGVVLAGTDRGRSDDALGAVGIEIARLLAATLEAALDRLDREAELRERDQRLQAQNRRLSEINQVNEIIREVDGALVDADSRADIETAVCERLTAGDRFAFAWVGDATAHNDHVTPRAWAGDASSYLDEAALSPTASGVSEPAVRTAADRSVTLVPNVADRRRDADWPAAALAHGFNSVLSVPLVSDDVLFGTVTVYDTAPNAFSETVRAVFAELGQTVGAAISSAQRKAALDGDTTVVVTYAVRDQSWLLGRLAADFDCQLTVESEVAGSTGDTRVVVSVDGADPDAVVAGATALVDVISGDVVQATGDSGVVSLSLRTGLRSRALAAQGVTRRQLTATPESGTLVAAAPDAATARAADSLLADAFASVDVTARRRQQSSADDAQGPSLTERQVEVAQVAYHSGFFDPSHAVSGAVVAETLGISNTAFYDHVNRIESKVFDAVFDDPGCSWVE